MKTIIVYDPKNDSLIASEHNVSDSDAEHLSDRLRHRWRMPTIAIVQELSHTLSPSGCLLCLLAYEQERRKV